MKLRALGALLVTALFLIQLGQACSGSFRTLDLPSGTVNAASCANDESSISAPMQSTRFGYLGSRVVSYEDRGDGTVRIEGDMLYFVNGPLPEKPLPPGVSQGVGVNSSGLWPNGQIPYVIDPALPNQNRIAVAVNHWNTNLAGVINWAPRTNETDYVYFTADPNGCYSIVGHFEGAGAHTVHLADGCGSGNVAHEMGHVIGLAHEQNRLDRDRYVTINYSSIADGKAVNFNVDNSQLNYQNYDFGSIMHYGLTAFSIDGSQTITPKVSVPAGVTVGQRQSLSAGDIATVKEMYGDHTPVTTSGTGVGLYGHYYASENFTGLVKERVDSTLDFNWGASSPASPISGSHFSVRWKGWIQPPTTGNYKLIDTSEDGSEVILDGKVLVNRLSMAGYSQTISPDVALQAGTQYPVTVLMVSQSGKAEIHLQWSKDGGASEIIPQANLIPDMTSEMATNLCTRP